MEDMPVPDLTLRGYGCEVHYMDTSTPEKVSYELLGVTFSGICPDCGLGGLESHGSYDVCAACEVRLTMEYLENKIITSG